jgi:glycogen synthase
MTHIVKSVFIIGKPHGIGGISIHVQQWIDILIKNNFFVELFDLTAQKDNETKTISQDRLITWQGTRIKVFFILFVRCIMNQNCLVHVHMSKGANLIYISPLLYVLNKIRPCIYTIHGGIFPHWIKTQRKLIKILLQRLFRTSSKIIAVNSAIKNTLVSELKVADSKVEVIPAYFPIRKPIERGNYQNDNSKINLMASGYPTNVYGWDLLLEAVSGMLTVCNLHLVFYNISDNNNDYLAYITNKANKISSCNILIYKELGHDNFLKILGKCNIFIRPTLTDGDSIAVREALSYGLQVIASDSAERPNGCILFRSSDVHDLRKKIMLCLTNLQNRPNVEVINTGKKLLNVYSTVMGSSDFAANN